MLLKILFLKCRELSGAEAVMMMMNCFCGMFDRRKAFSSSLSSSRDPNLRHAANRVWTCAEPGFRLSWMKLSNIDNHYTTAPQIKIIIIWYESGVLLSFIKSLNSVSENWLNSICWSSNLFGIFIKKYCVEFNLTFFGTVKENCLKQIREMFSYFN